MNITFHTLDELTGFVVLIMGGVNIQQEITTMSQNLEELNTTLGEIGTVLTTVRNDVDGIVAWCKSHIDGATDAEVAELLAKAKELKGTASGIDELIPPGGFEPPVEEPPVEEPV